MVEGAPRSGQPVPTSAWTSTATIDPPRPPAPPGTSTPQPRFDGGRGSGAPWWVVAVIALLAALLTGAGVFVWVNASSGAKNTANDALLTELRQQLQSMQSQSTRTKAELEALKKTGAGAGAGTAAKPADAASADKQYSLIKNVYAKSGTWYVTADYLQFLTGKAAADAATAHGDESPPPNDYYILNDNRQLRELPVAGGANVKIMGGTGGDPGHPRNQTISEFHDSYVSSNSDRNWVKDGVYILTIEGGKVTAIEQQFLP